MNNIIRKKVEKMTLFQIFTLVGFLIVNASMTLCSASDTEDFGAPLEEQSSQGRLRRHSGEGQQLANYFAHMEALLDSPEGRLLGLPCVHGLYKLLCMGWENPEKIATYLEEIYSEIYENMSKHFYLLADIKEIDKKEKRSQHMVEMIPHLIEDALNPRSYSKYVSAILLRDMATMASLLQNDPSLDNAYSLCLIGTCELLTLTQKLGIEAFHTIKISENNFNAFRITPDFARLLTSLTTQESPEETQMTWDIDSQFYPS